SQPPALPPSVGATVTELTPSAAARARVPGDAKNPGAIAPGSLIDQSVSAGRTGRTEPPVAAGATLATVIALTTLAPEATGPLAVAGSAAEAALTAGAVTERTVAAGRPLAAGRPVAACRAVIATGGPVAIAAAVAARAPAAIATVTR